MTTLDTNTNGLHVTGNFQVGDKLSTEEAQALIDSGHENDIYTTHGHHYKKTWIDGSHSDLTARAFIDNTADSGGSGSTTTSTTDDGSDSTTTDLDLAPEVEKLEASAKELETAADALKAEHGNTAVDDFEAAAGKLARAAEEVRENPTDESAIEELETAADELKNAAHALEGEIGDDQYQKIADAVDGFEKATDHMLAADDGEADMANAVAKATTALDTLTGAASSTSDASDADAADPYMELDALSDELNALTSGLMDKFGVEELADYEEATEQLEEAIDTFNADPTSEASIEGLEKAADALKEATAGLEGKIDDDIYQDVSTAVNAFEEAVDKLSGLDGQQAEVDKVASEIVDTLKDVVKATKEGIDGGSATTATDDTTGATDDTGTTTDTDDETPASTWTVDKEARTIQLDNGYSISLENADNAWTITDAEGNSTRIWGDPHVDENSDGSNDWDFYNNTTFTLDDDTKITVGTTEVSNGAATVTDTLTITKGDQAVEVTGIAANDVQISDVLTGGEDIDKALDDGEIRLEEGGANSWSDVTTQDVIDNNPVKDLEKATDNLKASSEGLGETDADIPELKAFEEATDKLETAGNNLSADPTSQENIDAFEMAADELKAATHALEGKIDADVYDNAASAVDDFEDAVDLAGVYAADGDTEDMETQIASATTSLQSLADIVKEAMTSADTTDDTTTDTDPEVTTDSLLGELEQATDDLKAFSEDLGAVFDTADLDEFEAATVKLEAAGDNLLEDASQENIDAFETAADELKAVTQGLEGKIDADLYEKVSNAVDGFEKAVDMAGAYAADGDTDDMDGQIALAVDSLLSLGTLVKDAVDSKESEAEAA